MHATTVSWPPSRTSTPSAAASVGWARPTIATSAPLRRRDSAATMRSGPCGSTTASSSITVPRCRRPGRADRRPGAQHHLDRPAAAFDRGHDRRARFDRALERRAVVRTGPDVEHHEHRRAAARFVLAHHQVTASRGRSPVHVAQVVAGCVLAQRVELAARLDARAHLRLLAVEIEAARLGRRQHVADARIHDHLFGAEHARALHEPERIGHRRAQRTDLEAAAPIGGEAVRRARFLAGVQRREQEARGAPAAVERVVDRERRCCCGSPGRRRRRDPGRRPGAAPSARGGRAAAERWSAPTRSRRASVSAAANASTASCTRPRMRPATNRPTAEPTSAHPRRVIIASEALGRRNLHRLEDRREHVGRADAARDRLGRQHEPVLEHRRREELHVVGHDVRTADARGERAAAAAARVHRAGSRRARRSR